jgi:hypothetical protein
LRGRATILVMRAGTDGFERTRLRAATEAPYLIIRSLYYNHTEQ